MSRHEIWQDIVATHFLESQIKVSQTGLNYGRYSSHSQSEEPSTGMNRYEIWQGIIATHRLKSQEQEL